MGRVEVLLPRIGKMGRAINLVVYAGARLLRRYVDYLIYWDICAKG